MDIIIAFDCGTTSMKAAAFDPSGRVVASVDASYRVTHAHPGWAEQDPDQLWSVLCQASQRLLAGGQVTSRQVVAVCFVAPWKDIIAVDDHGQVLHPSIIWMDGRAGAQSAALNARLGRFVGTGQEYWPRLMWLKQHRPQIWSRTRHMMGLNTYFKWRATGQVSTEPSDDFIHGSTPPRAAVTSEILAAAGLDEDRHLFPHPAPATDIVGRLRPDAAQLLGLQPGTPVIGGFGDIPAIAVGAGRAGVGQCHIYLGTSSWFLHVAQADSGLEAPLTATLTGSTEGLVYPLQTGCLARDWIIEQTYATERDTLGTGIHALIDEQVAQVPAGAANLLATHWLLGELPPLSKQVRGMYLNLTPSHDRRHLVRAMLEAISYSHRLSIDTHTHATGQRLTCVRAVGGGATSAVWMQILADVLQLHVEVPSDPRLAGAKGAFACAAVGLGMLPDLVSVDDTGGHVRTFEPNTEHAPTYDRLYGAYTRLHDAVAPIFHLLEPPPASSEADRPDAADPADPADPRTPTLSAEPSATEVPPTQPRPPDQPDTFRSSS